MVSLRATIIIVSYNTREMTLACLASVYAETVKTSFEVIVVDNASGDGSADAIRTQFPEVFLTELDANIGFAAANNRAATQASGDYLLLINPDTVVLDGAIDRLLNFAEKTPSAAIWGGKTVYADGSLNKASCWAQPTLWSVFCQAAGLSRLCSGSQFLNPEAYGGWDRNSDREVDIVSGCFLLIRHEFWNRLNGFDPAFYMYGEEADLCLRAAKVGARPRVTCTAQIVHYGGASEQIRSDKLVRLFTAKAMLMDRHWPRWQGFLGKLLLTGWASSRWLTMTILAAISKKYRCTRDSWRAVLSHRQRWQKRNVCFEKGIPGPGHPGRRECDVTEPEAAV